MSELKEAITYFEQLLRRFEDAPDETYWGKEHNATTRKMIHVALDAIRRAQPSNEPCADCTGIVYRQTTSGKVIPTDNKCAVMEPPPCYQPDGDGCAYQIYGNNNDEPIDLCKACPLCYSDKVRHNSNAPLTLEELRQMDGEPVYVVTLDNPLENQPYWAIAGINSNDSRYQNGVALYNRVQDDWGAFDLYGKTWLAYRTKPEGSEG